MPLFLLSSFSFFLSAYAAYASLLKISVCSFSFLRCGSIFQGYVRAVKEAGITPFIVFDGFRLPAKAKEDDRRQR